MSGTYVVRTFGCQMNEHDSERIAGLLEADGLEPGDDVETADVVVLNTCCIRENADNKLYGTLGHLKSLKDRRPDLEIVVAGCLAQKDRDAIAERAPHVDVVLGTHNVHRAVDLLHQSTRVGGAGHRDPRRDRRRRPRAVPLRAAGRPRGRRTPPGSRSRSAATTAARSASCRRCAAPRSADRSATSSPRSQRAARRRRHRGDAARPERQLLRPRPDPACAQRRRRCRRSVVPARPGGLGRRPGPHPPLFADLLRSVGSVAGHPAGPLHQPAPQGPASRDASPRWPRRRRCASTCTSRCSPAATGSCPRCTGATPPSATSNASRPLGPASTTWR